MSADTNERQVAILTGASSGVGLGITHVLPARGQLVYGVQSLPIGAPVKVDVISEFEPSRSSSK